MTQPIPQFKNDPILVLILSIVTCGLYLIYWNLKTAELINSLTEKETISPPIAIVCGVCCFANLYFYNVVGKEALPLVYHRTGQVNKDQSTLLTILGFLFAPAAAMIFQGEINKLYE